MAWHAFPKARGTQGEASEPQVRETGAWARGETPGPAPASEPPVTSPSDAESTVAERLADLEQGIYRLSVEIGSASSHLGYRVTIGGLSITSQARGGQKIRKVYRAQPAVGLCRFHRRGGEGWGGGA